jgi:hypothetical protein
MAPEKTQGCFLRIDCSLPLVMVRRGYNMCKNSLKKRTFTKNQDMANKRILKRNINEMVFDVVEECFFFEMTAPSKSDKSAQLIDEAADFQDAMLSKINKAKGKAEFRAIAAEVEAKAVYFVDALNGLNK